MTSLAELRVMLLDAQATAAHPRRGALLEIGWAPWSASEPRELSAASVTTSVVAAPPGFTVPPAVARITGLHTSEWVRGTATEVVWERFLRAAEAVAPPAGPVPAVIHFARFEEPFLRGLHEHHGTGGFPLDLVCTHAIARRLLPELPRRTLRALAGYFGAAVPPLRRSADHVVATAFVWRHLVALVAEREGIVELRALREWLACPAPRAARCFPLARERRLALPDRPGVYRLLRQGGAVVYVGKAASLRHRVGGHFHARARQGERALEMLTQVRDVSCTETETALEAALFETDEIKRLAPPFNFALAASGRAVWFAAADFSDVRERADARHATGPIASRAVVEAFAAVGACLAADEPPPLAVRARAVGVEPAFAPDPECFAAGLLQFVRENGRHAGAAALLRLGSRLWARRRAEAATVAAVEALEDEAPKRRRPEWDAERVCDALEESLLRADHARRRARWLLRLSESSLAWAESDAERQRLLVFHGGVVAERTWLEPGMTVPVPPGHARPLAERRSGFDLAGFDRLRVLTTELRGLAADAATVELRLGPHVRLSRRRLQTVLRWV